MRTLRLTEDEYKALCARRARADKSGSKGQGNRALTETKRESKLERRFEQQLALAGVHPPVRNYFPIRDRDFELDFAWPGRRVAVEIQGMAHRIKGKWKRDIEKRALLLLDGWRVLELDGDAVRSGRGIEWLKKLLAHWG